MVSFPAQIDTGGTGGSLPTVADNLTRLQGILWNRLRDAIIAIESELGVKPSGSSGTVRARLDTMDNTLIKIAGDIGGTSAVPLVIGIQGNPVVASIPNPGDVLTWSGSFWFSHAPPSGTGGSVTFSNDLSGTSAVQTVVGISGRPIANTAPAAGQALVWSGSQWVPGSVIDAVFNVVNNDFTVSATSFGAVVAVSSLTANHIVSLPATPTLGQRITVKDADGSLASFNITVNGNGHNIDNAATFVMSSIQGAFSSIEVQFNGTIWLTI